MGQDVEQMTDLTVAKYKYKYKNKYKNNKYKFVVVLTNGANVEQMTDLTTVANQGRWSAKQNKGWQHLRLLLNPKNKYKYKCQAK